jgi:L-threonylcarbamoyladenylate synthase
MQQDIKSALQALRNGGVIIYPSDTMWAIGCDATNADAVARIYNIKQRNSEQAMLVLASSFAMVESYIDELPAMATELDEYSEKPLTIIYENARGLASNLLGDNNSIGIRIPRDKFLEQLLLQFKKPIVSTSANISGKKAPVTFADIDPDILKEADHVSQHKRTDAENKQASSIIMLKTNGEIRIIRQ